MGVLHGKIAVITGGTRGFGLEVAKAYIKEGATVVVASRSADSILEAVKELRGLGSQVSGIACDVSDLAQVQALADHTVGSFGRFDVWVNNAGISGPYGPTIHIDPDIFTRVTQTNVTGVYFGSLIAMRHFLLRKEGKLINVLGAGERRAHIMQNAYTSSKAWVRNFTHGLAMEYESSGVGVYALSPGMMDTDMLLQVEVVSGYEERLDRFESIVRILSQSPDIPARKAVWLASAATDGRTDLTVREFSSAKMLRVFLRAGLNSLLRRPWRPVNLQIKRIPAGFSVDEELES